MNTTTATVPTKEAHDQAVASLMASVHNPIFFAKIAEADPRLIPANDKEAETLLAVGGELYDRYQYTLAQEAEKRSSVHDYAAARLGLPPVTSKSLADVYKQASVSLLADPAVQVASRVLAQAYLN